MVVPCISCTSHGFPSLTMVTSWRTVMCHSYPWKPRIYHFTMAPTCFPWQTIICLASFHGIVTPFMANLALTYITPYISCHHHGIRMVIHDKPCHNMYYTIYIMSSSWHTNGRSMYIMYKSWLSSSDHGNIMAHCHVPFIPLKPTNVSLYNGTHMYFMAKYNTPCFLLWHSHAIHGKPCPDMYYTIYVMSPSWHVNDRAMYIMSPSWH